MLSGLGRYQGMKSLSKVLYRMAGWLGGDAVAVDADAGRRVVEFGEALERLAAEEIELEPDEYGEHPV